MEKLLQELSRRKVLSSLLLYAMAAWLILQVTDVIAEPLLLPPWIQRSVVIAAILGFPCIAVLSWFFDLTKSGLVETDASEHDSRKPLGFGILSIAATCLLGISVLISQQWDVAEKEQANEPRLIRLAILPFEGSSNQLEPHLDRLSDELSVRLANNSQIRLASSNAIAALKPGMDTASTAEQLGVQFVLDGTLAQGVDGMELTTSLFDVEAGEDIWERDFQNAQIYVVNDLVVSEILEFFNLQPAGGGLLTTNANAYNLYLRGLMTAARGTDKEEAVRLFEQSLAEDARFPLPYASLCGHYVREYRALRSIEAFETAERNCFRALTLDADSLEVHEAMGQIYSASGQLELARDYFGAALEINPQHFESKLGLARTYISEDPIFVESILTELLREQPGDPAVYSALQNLYFNQGRYADAVEPARLALQLNPESESAQFNLAGNLLLAGFFTEAKELLQNMLDANTPRRGSIQNTLATVYFFEGEYGAAAELYREALQREPDNAIFARNLGDALWHQVGKDEATELFERVIELGQRHLQINPDDSYVLSCLMVAYGSLGNQQRLNATLQDLLQLSASDPQAHYDAAVAYSRLGNTELSSQHASMARDLGYPSALIQTDPDLRGIGITIATED